MSTLLDRIPSTLRHPSWHRAQAFRRLLAAILLAAAVATFFLEQLAASHTYVVLSKDLSPGTVISSEHLTTRTLRESAGVKFTFRSADEAQGKVVITPLREGDFLSQHHVLGPDVAAIFGPDVDTLVPIKLADPAAAELAMPGTTVSVVAAQGENQVRTIASGAKVIFSTARHTDSSEAGTVLLALDPQGAQAVAAASLGTPLTVILTPHNKN